MEKTLEILKKKSTKYSSLGESALNAVCGVNMSQWGYIKMK